MFLVPARLILYAVLRLDYSALALILLFCLAVYAAPE